VNEVWEFGGVSQEEDWGVVGDQIPVALVCSELDRETSGVSSAVVRARLTTNGGKADGNWAFLTLFREHVSQTELWNRICALEETMSTGTLGVNHSFWDTLSVEVSEEVDQVEVLEQEWTVLADSLGLVGMWHRNAIAGCVDGVG